MKAKRVFAKVLALALVAVMLLGMMAVTAAADQAATVAEGDQDGLKMNKTVTLEDDGTYTVKLEAYATGETTIETVKQVKPADVILVLDQSGSMAQEEMSGIPTDTYTKVSSLPTNEELAEGTTEYFYEQNGHYYRVTAVKEVTGKTIGWLGDDGNEYSDDEIAYSWSRKSDGQEYVTTRPFVASSLKTFTRTHDKGLTSLVTKNYRYVDDVDGTESGYSDLTGDYSGAKGARYYFINGKDKSLTEAGGEAYGVSPRTAEFHNDGAPNGGSGHDNATADDPFYVAASYIAVTKSEINTVRYIYTVEIDGIATKIGQSAEDAETDVDGATVSISPLYTQDTTDGTRLDALKYAAEKFIDNIRTSALKNAVDHRVAIVGFGSDEYKGNGSDVSETSKEYYWANTELFVGATQYNYYSGGKESTYNQSPNLAKDHYGDAFQSVNTETGYDNLIASVGELAGKGATHPKYGFEMANGIFAEESAAYTDGNRSKIVIFLTDGTPGDSGYDAEAVQNALNTINVTKETYGAKVYTVAVLDSITAGSNEENFLKDSSSDGTYTLATDVSKLESFFESVDKEISSSTTSVDLTERNHVIDLFSDYFTVPEGFSTESNVTLQIAEHAGYESFYTPTAAPDGVQAELLEQNGVITGVDVTGFHFVSAENTVTTDDSGGSVKATGNKLVITITGLLAKDEAAQNLYIDTNKSYSGIWDDDEDGNFGLLKAFNMPSTYLAKKTYVLDYAKGITLTEYETSATPKFDSAEDYIFSKVGEEDTTATTAYGNVEAKDGQITYTPNTMQWDGFDSIYALTKNTEFGDYTTKYMWSKLTVIPASNVYYEDTFVSSEETGTVGIVFSGEWKEEILDGAGSNTETPNNTIHGGWVENDTGLSDDTMYSDGSAHYAQITENSQSATATFTFTGTGFDIYSRTNSTTGTILVEVKPEEALKAEGVKTQYLLIDNLSESGDYYQIPTVGYMSNYYGTYTVTLWVTSAAGDRTTYYLDGIRIYNPNLTNVDDTVIDAMGDEMAVSFRNLRELLLEDAGEYTEETQLDGVVFIDKMDHVDGTEGETSYVAVYEEFGPKNEIYVAKGQSIAFKVDPGKKMQIGLKAPEASEAIAVVSMMDGDEAVQQTINIAHSTDLYYELMPDAEGNVVIRNDGEGLLSITKVKTFQMQEDDTLTVYTTAAEMLSAVEEFESRRVVEYKTLHSTTEEEPVEPTEPTEPETPSVDINNPTEPEEDDTVAEQIRQFVTGLFNTLRGWFGRR